MIEELKTNFGLSEESIDALVKCLTREEFSKHDYLFYEGHRCNDYFFIEQGVARMGYLDEKKNFITLWFMQENDFASSLRGFIPVKRGRKSKKQCACQLVCQFLSRRASAYRLSHENMLKLTAEYPEISQLIMQISFKTTTDALSVIREVKRPLKEKLIDFMRDKSDIMVRIPGYHLADYLGVAPEVLSRLKTALKQEKNPEIRKVARLKKRWRNLKDSQKDISNLAM
ncbi:MAG: Crp/Fnr family transcriptional regulator [Mangrovibacterium sp.]